MYIWGNWKNVDRVKSNFYLVESEIKEYLDRYEVSVSFSFFLSEIFISDYSNHLARQFSGSYSTPRCSSGGLV